MNTGRSTIIEYDNTTGFIPYPFWIIPDRSGPIPDQFWTGPEKFSPAAGSLSGITLSGEQPPAARCAGANIKNNFMNINYSKININIENYISLSFSISDMR